MEESCRDHQCTVCLYLSKFAGMPLLLLLIAVIFLSGLWIELSSLPPHSLSSATFEHQWLWWEEGLPEQNILWESYTWPCRYPDSLADWRWCAIIPFALFRKSSAGKVSPVDNIPQAIMADVDRSFYHLKKAALSLSKWGKLRCGVKLTSFSSRLQLGANLCALQYNLLNGVRK